MPNRRTVLVTLAALAALAPAGCATSKKGDIKILESTLMAHGSVMRFGKVVDALAFVDPDVRAKHPPTSFELSRWEQLRVGGYHEQPYVLTDPLHALQVVEIELINNHTQAVRSIVDRQQWRFDPEQKRWWLMTGLPKLD
jgi:hypothetical protein